MLIAVPVMGNDGMSVELSDHFGHAPFFAFVEVEKGKVESVEFKANPFEEHHIQGNVPNFLIQNGVNVLIAGNMGQRAYDILSQNGIEIYPYTKGNMNEAINSYLSGIAKSDYTGDHVDRREHGDCKGDC